MSQLLASTSVEHFLINFDDAARSELLTVPELAERLRKTEKSADRIMSIYQIGGRTLGRSVTHRVAVRLLEESSFDALALFRAGDRSDPRIARAYVDEGLTPPAAKQAEKA